MCDDYDYILFPQFISVCPRAEPKQKCCFFFLAQAIWTSDWLRRKKIFSKTVRLYDQSSSQLPFIDQEEGVPNRKDKQSNVGLLTTESMVRTKTNSNLDNFNWLCAWVFFSCRKVTTFLVVWTILYVDMKPFSIVSKKLSTKSEFYWSSRFYPIATAFVQRTYSVTSQGHQKRRFSSQKHCNQEESTHIRWRSPSSRGSRSTPLIDCSNRVFSSSSTLLSISRNGVNEVTNSVENQDCELRMIFLQGEMNTLVGCKDFNANSPQQRSMAIFGEIRSCTKDILKQIANASETISSEHKHISEDKRRLAQHILEYLDLQKLHREQASPRLMGDRIVNSTADVKARKQVESENNSSPFAEATMSSPPVIASISGDDDQKGRKGQRRKPRQRPKSHEENVEKLFSNPQSSQLDPYWKEPLLQLSRPIARDLVKQLNSELCPMAFDPDMTAEGPAKKKTVTGDKRTGFLGYCRDQKDIYKKHLVLVRCGDFYETFGVDAILMVEHVGLNPMGLKVKAGCPKNHIQATLNGLTTQGFSVAVYEELEAVGISNANGLKDRYLAQIVFPAQPTYLYDNWLLGGNSVMSEDGEAGMSDASYALDALPPPRPCVGVVHTAAGYNIVEVSLEEMSVQYSERLTAEAVACRLAAYPPADPLIYIPSHSEMERGTSSRPSFFPRTRRDTSTSNGSYHRLQIKILDPDLVPDPLPGISDDDRFIKAIVNEMLQMNEIQSTTTIEQEPDPDARPPTTINDFTVTRASVSTNPLYIETATQIGLMNDKTIPSLIRNVLDDTAPAVTRRFLHRYLLIPPPPSVARSMALVVETLIDESNTISLPPLTVPNLGKSLILVRAGQAGANLYGELLQSLATTIYLLEHCEDDDDEIMEPFVEALLHICQHESGLPTTRNSLFERCKNAVATIESVVSSSYHVEEDYDSIVASQQDVISQDDFIPMAFLERNERGWRGRVQRHKAKNAYERVEKAVQKLSQAIKDDFIGNDESNKASIKISHHDNLIALNKKPNSGSFQKEISYMRPSDRFGKDLTNRFTTEKVKQAVFDYVSECENATKEVKSILSDLAKDLQEKGHIPAIVQSSHFNLILSTAFHHAVKARNSKWQLASTVEESDSSIAGAHFVDVFPYWMNKAKAVTNSFDLSSMILLTAPNMSGKSTLMRSTAAAALLTVCGLCAPLSSDSRIPRFDTLFLRGASADVPSEDKSAFGAEMGDLAALFRCSGEKSMVFVDELGRGTSPRDGTRLAGAVLEAMANSGMSGIFATHLHDILELPLKKDRITTKRIEIKCTEDKEGVVNYSWTHKLEDGICKDSMALVTAEKFGLPDEIISRARELTVFLPEKISSHSSSSDKLVRDISIDLSAPHKVELEGSALPESEINNDPNRWNELKQSFENEFQDVKDLATSMFSVETIHQNDDDKTKDMIDISKSIIGSVEVPPNHHPPASLSDRSCLYILQLIPERPALDMKGNEAKYYVGQTDSIGKRLKQHRKKWKTCRTMVFPLGNKSNALYYESSLIRIMAQKGYFLASKTDGRSLRPFRE